MSRRLRELFRDTVAFFGGFDALAAALDRPLSYSTKIVEACAGVADRRIQQDWLAPMFRDPAVKHFYLSGLSEIFGYPEPERPKMPTADNLVGAMIDAFDRLGEVGKEQLVKLAASKCTTVEALRRACGR